MIVVRIEHPVADYEAWKGAFDADPADRRGPASVATGSSARRTTNSVMVDLGDASRAEAMLASLRAVWDRVQGTVISTRVRGSSMSSRPRVRDPTR
jgi:hypothetical protein